MYRLLANFDGVQRIADGALIPADPANAAWQAYQAWAGQGNAASAVPLEDLHAVMWARIRAERDRRTREGGYAAAGKWFHSDEFSRTQQLGLVLLGNSIPGGTLWKTMDGSFVTMTATLAQQVFAAAAASDIAVFAAAEAHRAAMEQAEDPAAYDYSGGWPAAFGE